LCSRKGQIKHRSSFYASQSSVANDSHDFERNKTFTLIPARKIIKQPPMVKCDFQMCNRMKRRNKCTPEKYQLAHGKEELQMWEWVDIDGGKDEENFRNYLKQDGLRKPKHN